MSSSSAFSFRSLKAAILQMRSDGIDGDHVAEIGNLVRLHASVLNTDLMLFALRDENSARSRQFLAGKYKNDRPRLVGILSMSDELDLNEFLCERYWEYAHTPDEVRRLEAIVGKGFRDNHGAIAEEFYLLDCRDLLEGICLLFRSSYDEHLSPLTARGIRDITNSLLRDAALPTNLLCILTHFGGVLAQESERDGSEKPSRRAAVAESCVLEVAKCIFFIFDDTQILEAEACLLLEALRAFSHFTGHLPEDDGAGRLRPHRAMFSSLVVLQMSYACALSRQRTRRSRYVDAPYIESPQPDPLPQQSSREGVGKPWTSRLARGFSCLVHAVATQPVVEDVLHPDAFLWLQEASELRAFSYLRTCVIPYLQSTLLDSDLRMHLVRTLRCDLLQPLSALYAGSEDWQMRVGSAGFSLAPRAHYEIAAAQSRSAAPAGSEDCLDDLLDLFAAMGSACPVFATLCWESDQARFIKRALEDNARDEAACRWLSQTVVRLLCGLAGTGRDTKAARKTFLYVQTKLGPRLSWEVVFKSMDSFFSSPPCGDDAEALSFTQLICSAVREPSTAEVLRPLSPVRRLLGLVVADSSLDLKGGALLALAALATQTAEYADEAWQAVETAGLLAPAGSGSSDLRTLLETAETEERRYPVTDGFLSLMAALLRHGAPDMLGLGTRRPGILLHLEYMVEEVLVKGPDRPFLDEAHRYRLLAKAAAVLQTVLLNYPINLVRSLRLTHPPPSELSGFFDVEADFTADSESLVSYEVHVRGKKTTCRSTRPKRSGFTVMAWLLCGGRLLDSLLAALDVASGPSHCCWENDQEAGALREALSILAASRSSTRRSDVDRDLHLRGWAAVDMAYWKQATAAAVVGLLFTCAEREHSFVDYVSSAGCALSMITSDDSRPSRQAVQLRPLAELLLSHRSVRAVPIALVAQHLQCAGASIGGIPLPAMAIALLRHVASIHNADVFSDALSAGAGGLEALRRGCVAALLAGEPSSAPDTTIMRQGSEETFDAVGSPEAAGPCESSRSALLQLLVDTLYSEKLGLSHFLLGFDDELLALAAREPHPLLISARLADPLPGSPGDCFEAILDLLGPAQRDADTPGLVHTHPAQARCCFKVIARLCSATNTSAAALAILRKRTTGAALGFFERQLHLCLSRMKELKSEMEYTMEMLTSDAAAEEALLSQHDRKRNSDFSDLLQCVSSLLNICSLELHTLSEAEAAQPEGNCRAIFDLFVAEAGAACPIISLLGCVHMSSVDAGTATRLVQAVRQLTGIAMLQSHGVFLGGSVDEDCSAADAEGIQDRLEHMVLQLLLPVLAMIADRDGDVETEEQLAMMLLPMINVVNKASKVAWLTLNQYNIILRGLLIGLLFRNDVCAPGDCSSEVRRRGCLSACLLHVLRYGAASDQAQSYHRGSIHILEPVIAALAEALGADMAGTAAVSEQGNEQWFLAAAALLSQVLSTLGPTGLAVSGEQRGAEEDFRSHYGSHAFLQAVQVLSSHGHLRAVMSSLRIGCAASEAEEVASQAVLNLFFQIAATSVGVNILLDNGLRERLSGMGQFTPGDMMYRDSDGMELGAEDVYGGGVDETLLALLRLLRAVGVADAASADLCARFIHSNYEVVRRALIGSGKAPRSLAELSLTESIVALSSVVASSASCGDEDLADIWDGGLGQFSEVLTAALSELLRQVGTSLFRGHEAQGSPGTAWWSAIRPASDFEEQQLATVVDPPALVAAKTGGREAWTVFDNRLLELGLRTLKHVALTLRLRAADAAGTESSSASGIDFDSMGYAFCSCAELLSIYAALDPELVRDGRETDRTNRECAVGDATVNATLQFVSENLICILYFHVLKLKGMEIMQAVSGIEKILESAENTDTFPSHSLVSSTARWIRWKVESSESY